MKIEWIGHSCFRLTAADGTVVITDPYDDSVGIELVPLEADLVTMSHNHHDHNFTGMLRGAPRIARGVELAHVGINSADEAEAMDTATKLCKLLGWTMKVGNSSIFAGTGVEVMKTPFRGTKGHIGIKTNFIERAKAYLERQGFEFDPASANVKDGQLKAIYLKDEIAGFAVHLVQK